MDSLFSNNAQQYLVDLQEQSLASLTTWATGLGVLSRGQDHMISPELIKDSSKRLSKQIHSFLAVLKSSEQNLLRNIPVGFLFLPSFNAYTLPCPNGGQVIALNIKLEALLLRLNSVLVMWMGGLLPYPIKEYVRMHIRDQVDPLRDIIRIPYEVRNPEKISEFFQDPTTEFKSAKLFTSHQLLFICAHEMSHVLCGHPNTRKQILSISEKGNLQDENNVEAIIRSHEQEYEADQRGLELTALFLDLDPSSGLFFAKLAFFFLISQLYERVNKILNLVQKQKSKSPIIVTPKLLHSQALHSTHPPNFLRIERLRTSIFSSNTNELSQRLLEHSINLFDEYFLAQLEVWFEKGMIKYESSDIYSSLQEMVREIGFVD